MRDAIEGRLWAEHGHLFSEQIGQTVETAMVAFRRLAAIEFDAPWREANSGKC